MSPKTSQQNEPRLDLTFLPDGLSLAKNLFFGRELQSTMQLLEEFWVPKEHRVLDKEGLEATQVRLQVVASTLSLHIDQMTDELMASKLIL